MLFTYLSDTLKETKSKSEREKYSLSTCNRPEQGQMRWPQSLFSLGWKKPNFLNHHSCLLGSVLAGSWSQEMTWVSNSGTSTWDMGVLDRHLKHPYNVLIPTANLWEHSRQFLYFIIKASKQSETNDFLRLTLEPRQVDCLCSFILPTWQYQLPKQNI